MLAYSWPKPSEGLAASAFVPLRALSFYVAYWSIHVEGYR